MPRTYFPDGWVVVKLSGTDPHYRIFGSWRGNWFTEPDRWKLNSGIVACSYDEESQLYTFSGHSGSSYHCHKHSYGQICLYNQSVLDNFINKSDNLMEVMDDVEDWTKKDWTI